MEKRHDRRSAWERTTRSAPLSGVTSLALSGLGPVHPIFPRALPWAIESLTLSGRKALTDWH